jgi:hypothetical protein
LNFLDLDLLYAENYTEENIKIFIVTAKAAKKIIG